MNKTLENILILEGGYVDNPKDKGGATNWGITEATARKHGFLNDMRDLTRSEAYAILEEDYWIKPGFKDVANLSESIAFELCDAAVNIGQHHPVLWLQRWLNVLNREERSYQDIVVDGKIGPYTMATLQYYLTVRGEEGEEVLVKALNCSQGAWYLSLAEKNQQHEEFIYGWMKNRVS